MVTIEIFLKGWRDSQLYTDAVNDERHADHEPAMVVYRSSYQPYTAGDAIYHAITYTEPAEPNDMVHCERAFERFNVGADDIARRYRNAGHRSLSVGDIVTVDRRAYTVDRLGWKVIENFMTNSPK